MLCVDAADNLPHAVDDGLDRCIAVAAEVVDAFKPDHRGYAGKLDYIAVDPHLSRWPAGKRLLRPILRRPRDLIAADARIDHRHSVAIGRVETTGEHVGPAIVAVHR